MIIVTLICVMWTTIVFLWGCYIIEHLIEHAKFKLPQDQSWSKYSVYTPSNILSNSYRSPWMLRNLTRQLFDSFDDSFDDSFVDDTFDDTFYSIVHDIDDMDVNEFIDDDR